MKLNKITYSLKDIAVVQAPISYIHHRKDVNPFINVCNREMYPIFVAPMGAVTDECNYQKWIDSKVTPIIPRTVQKRLTFDQRIKLSEITFVSISLQEAENELMEMDYDINDPVRYICIDIAHGTLSSLFIVCKKIKDRWGEKMIIMTGNVATPDAYRYYCKYGIDYCRVSIGSGSRCTSSCNVSIHYGMATLIDEIIEERNKLVRSGEYSFYTKIVADGGIGWFDDIQKALALGADAVMIGKLFAECEEACGEVVYAESYEDCMNGKIYHYNEVKDCLDNACNNLKPFREYYGMSTKRAQSETNGNSSKTSEGISRPVEVKYPVAKWIDNMNSYLRSCMTYTNSRTIEELHNAEIVILGGSGDYTYRK